MLTTEAFDLGQRAGRTRTDAAARRVVDRVNAAVDRAIISGDNTHADALIEAFLAGRNSVS